MSGMATGPQQPPQFPQQKPYEYTADELRVLQECRSESFWYRCVPFALGGALLTRYLISRGILTAKRGPAPKMIFAGMGGYFIGKLSYIKTCNDKILSLQNSPLADAIREGNRARKLGLPPPPAPGVVRQAPQPGYGMQENQSGVQVTGYQPDDAHSNMDIDTSNVKTIDDYVEHEFQDEGQQQQAKPNMTTTYEELRQKNRATRPIYSSRYAPQQEPQSGQQSYQQSPFDQDQPAPVQQKTSAPVDEEFPLGRSRKKNKYGDDWE